MELNEMEKKLLFQVEGDYQTKILNELYMTVRYSNNSEQREAAEGLIQDRLYKSDFDRFLMLEQSTHDALPED